MNRTRIPLLFMVFLGFATHSVAQSFIDPSRRIDWTQAGIPGGIPVRTTICATLNAATYGNGSTNATSAIQNAIDGCPAGQVVYLPAGTYVTTQTIHLRSNRTLRGAGPGQTTISYQGATGRSVLDIKGNTYNDIWSLRRTFAVTGGATKDSRQITLSSTAGISVGDVLLIDQLNDGVLVDYVGKEGPCAILQPGGWNPRSGPVRGSDRRQREHCEPEPVAVLDFQSVPVPPSDAGECEQHGASGGGRGSESDTVASPERIPDRDRWCPVPAGSRT